MNARQKAKVYKKQRDYLYQALLNSIYENHKIGEEIRRDIIDIVVDRRYNLQEHMYIDKYEEAVIDEMLYVMSKSDEFKQSVAVEKYRDPLTDEMVYRAHLQTIRPKMEE